MIRKACLEGVSVDIFDSAKPLVRSFKRAKRVEPVETITNASSGSGSSVETSEQAPQATGPVDHVSVDIGPDPNGAGGGHPTQVDAGGQDPPGDGEAKTSGEQQAIEVTAGVAQRILLGTVVPSGRSVYWEYNHDELPNRHLLVFGASGTGKTYTIQALLCELAKAGQNSLIVDYTSGFTDAQMEARRGRCCSHSSTSSVLSRCRLIHSVDRSILSAALSWREPCHHRTACQWRIR